MKKRILICVLTLAMLFSMLSIGVSAANTVKVQVGGVVDYAQAEQVFRNLNEYRLSKGLSALVLDAGLTSAAQQRAIEAAIYTSHTRPDGTKFNSVIVEVYGKSGTSAENLAWGQTSASQVITSWKNSSGHNKNMLKTDVTHVGVACVYVNGVYTWVQLFSSVGQDKTNDYSGKTNAPFLVQVNALPDKLTAPQTSKTLNVQCGTNAKPVSFSLNYKYNASDSQSYAYLIPTIITAKATSYTVKDSRGTAIATIELNRNGESGMTVTGLNPGTATIDLPIYSGQSSPFRLTLVVSESHVHNYVSSVYEPTCVNYGWTYYRCSGCGHSYTERIPATGKHVYEDWTYHVEPTLYSTGSRYKACIHYDDCKEIIWENVPKLTNPFVDVPSGAFYTEPVAWAVFREITTGMDTTHFAPDGNCTRGQIVTFLWRAQGKPAPQNTDNPFVDVAKGSYCYDAVLWAVEQGITNGVDATHFAPNNPCTRAQAVTFLWRANGEPECDSWNIFFDVREGTFYYDAVLWAVDENITKGTDSWRFSPDNSCTRGQIVTFLHRSMH